MKRVQREQVEQEEEAPNDSRLCGWTDGRLCELLFILITHVPLPRVLISQAVRQRRRRRHWPYNRKINAPRAAFAK